MTFSREWEERYSEGTHLSVYPWSDMVALVMRHANPKSYPKRPKVLELGSGAGANISFFLDKGFEYHGIEGSETAVKTIRERFLDRVKIECRDFTESLPYDNGTFDLVVDRAATTHNKLSSIEAVIRNAAEVLATSGLFIAVDWFSTQHPMFSGGTEIEPNTKTGYGNGAFKDIGVVHFFTIDEIKSLFIRDFDILYLEHKSYETILPEPGSGTAAYNIVARKKI